MSPYLFGENNEILAKGKDLDVVQPFKYKKRVYSILWTIIPLSGDSDITEEMNKKIAEAKGEAMINVSVESAACALNLVPVISLVPLWVGCANITIEGEIVKRKAAL